MKVKVIALKLSIDDWEQESEESIEARINNALNKRLQNCGSAFKLKNLSTSIAYVNGNKVVALVTAVLVERSQ